MRADGETTHVICVDFSYMLNTDVKFVGSNRWKGFLWRWSSCGVATFGIGGAKPLMCLVHVALLGINGVGAVLFVFGSLEVRPRSIIASLYGAQPGGIDREAS